MSTTPPEAPDGAPAPRRRRPLRVVLAALAGVVVVLAVMIGVGSLLGANTLPWQQVRAGRTGAEVYAVNCARCHGVRGEGGSLQIRGPAFTPGGPLAGLTFAERVEKTGRGRPLAGMPRWRGKLTEEEIRKVAAYTQRLSGQQPDPSVRDVE